jgi:hypothetical protein
MNKPKYLNFPIQLLSGFMNDSKGILNKIVSYVVYQNSLKLIYGNEIEKIDKSANYYNVNLCDSMHTLHEGKNLYDSIPVNSPKVGFNLSIFWDFYNNDKTEFDKICLLGFLAIKSIIGSKPYCKATNLYLWARMDGKVKSINNVEELSTEIMKFANEYQTKKIKTTLRNDWGLVHYSRYTRGFYVSFDLTLKQLILEVEKQRLSTKDKQYKQREKEILKDVLEQLKTTRT